METDVSFPNIQCKENSVALPPNAKPLLKHIKLSTGVGEQLPIGMVGTGVQMTALEKAGLIKGTPQVVEQKAMFGNSIVQQPVTRYALTPEAETFLHHPPRTMFGANSADARDLCYGKRALDQVVDWEGPMTMGSYAEATVIYTYKIEGTAPWAADADIQKAFPNVPRLLHPEGGMKGRVVLKKTALGWSAKGLE